MRLDQTLQYKEAFHALSELQRSHGTSEELKAIARYLLFSSESEAETARFPFVGLGSDPRDRAVVQAYEQAWDAFINGDEPDEI